VEYCSCITSCRIRFCRHTTASASMQSILCMPQPYACCLRRAAPTSASCAQQSRRVPLGPSSSGQPAVRCQPTPLGHECRGSVGKLANALEQCVTPVWIVPLSNYERTHPSACLALCPCGCAALWPVQRKVNPQWPVLTSMQTCCGRAGDIKARLALATAWYTRLCCPSLCRPSCQSVAPQPTVYRRFGCCCGAGWRSSSIACAASSSTHAT
jgi:hypothetical protein